MNVENKCSRCQELEKKIHELEKMLMTDPLTGLPNKSFLEFQFKALQADFQRKGRNFALGFLDIDHFKSINDTHGHDVGDKVIVTLASLLQKSVRATDTAARLHGDEFAVLMSDVRAEKARTLMDRIRAKVERISCYKIKIPITISVGVAGYTNGHKDIAHLIQSADRAMYQSKKRGRNIVSVYMS